MTAAVSSGAFVVGGALSGTAGAALLNQMVAIMAELPGGAAGASLTIAGGLVTPATASIVVDTEGAASTDTLTNLVTTNHPAGRIVIVRAASSDRVVTLAHASGGDGEMNMADNANFVLDATDKYWVGIRSGTTWFELFRQYGTDVAAHRTYLGMPLANSFLSNSITISSGQHSGNIAHGLGGTPTLLQVIAICQTDEEGFNTDDVVVPGGDINDGSPSGVTVGASSASVWLKCAVATNPIVAGRRAGAGGLVRLTNANWRLKIRAWR